MAGIAAHFTLKGTDCHAEVGATNLSDAHFKKGRQTTTSDCPLSTGTTLIRPMNQEIADADSADGGDLSYLCERCRKLDFDSIFSRRRTQVGGDPILWFDSKHKAVVDERCPFCQAMRFIHPSLEILPQRARKEFPLVVTTYQDTGTIGLPKDASDVQDVTKDNVCLTFANHSEPFNDVRQIFRWTKHNIETRFFESVYPRITDERVGYLAEKPTIEADKSALPAASIQPFVNFRMINNRLNECREGHEKCISKRGEYIQKVPGMRLIDYRLETVVPAPEGHVAYAALSYVWGDYGEAQFGNGLIVGGCSGRLPDPLPNTISDAILVTRRMKMRYLWIDRYCIRQDASTKKERTRSMDRLQECIRFMVAHR